MNRTQIDLWNWIYCLTTTTLTKKNIITKIIDKKINMTVAVVQSNDAQTMTRNDTDYMEL